MDDELVDQMSDLFKDGQLPYTSEDPLDWKYLIEGTMESKDYEGLIDGMSPREAGDHVHEWLEDEFSDIPGTKWENFVETDDETVKYDCFDGDYVYEFKTKFDHRLGSDTLPTVSDREQIDRYLDALDLDYGVLVYISRETFDVEEYLIPASMDAKE